MTMDDFVFLAFCDLIPTEMSRRIFKQGRRY